MGILPGYTSRTGLNNFLKKHANDYNIIIRAGGLVDAEDGWEWQSVRYLIREKDLYQLKKDIENGKI